MIVASIISWPFRSTLRSGKIASSLFFTSLASSSQCYLSFYIRVPVSLYCTLPSNHELSAASAINPSRLPKPCTPAVGPPPIQRNQMLSIGPSHSRRHGRPARKPNRLISEAQIRSYRGPIPLSHVVDFQWHHGTNPTCQFRLAHQAS